MLTVTKKKFSMFLNNKVDIYYYNKDIHYSIIISCNKNLIVMDSNFNSYFKNYSKENLALKIEATYVYNSNFYSLSKNF